MQKIPQLFAAVEWRTIFRQVTIFRHLFWISCNFFISYRNRFLSSFVNEFQYAFIIGFKEIIKFCFRILKIILVKCGEIWFLWRNMVLCSTCHWKHTQTVWSMLRNLHFNVHSQNKDDILITHKTHNSLSDFYTVAYILRVHPEGNQGNVT